MTHVVAREYDLIVRGNKPEGAGPDVHGFPPDDFDDLRRFVQTPVVGRTGESEVLARPTLRGQQPALRLRQWVGVIRVPGGSTLEILPKTHERDKAGDDRAAVTHSRAVLMRMLAAAGTNYREALPADLDPARMPLFEVVLRYALEVLKAAIRRGVPHTYLRVEEERLGLRGRLDMPRQVRQPPHRAHLLHVAYDEFLPDRPETRLVRLTLERIARLTVRDDHRRLSRELLFSLDGVPPSRDVRRDFSAWKLERGYVHFAPAEGVCKLILNELNPLTAGTATRSIAVMFDMNRVFEEYVAGQLQKSNPEWTVNTQVRGHHLGHITSIAGGTQPAFRLRPDLLLQREGLTPIVADTKWKRLTVGKGATLGVSGADAYQMLAYSQVLQPGNGPFELWLIYPLVEGLPESATHIHLVGERMLRIIQIDLDQPDWHLTPHGLGLTGRPTPSPYAAP